VSVDHAATDQHVLFAGRLARWLEKAGVADESVGELAVGFADILNAASRASAELERLLGLDPTTAEGADAALTHLGYLNALFLSEVKGHVDDLERHWDALEGPLAARAPDEESEG
jgi:hypothetical protein